MSDPATSSAGARADTERADATHVARSGAVQILTVIAQAVIAITHVLFARLYGQTVFGLYQTAVAALEVFTRGGTVGADKAMLRYVAAHRAADDKALVRSALGSGLKLCVAVGGAFAIVLAIGADAIADLLDDRALGPALRAMAALPVLTGCMWILVQASIAARVTATNFFVRGLAEPSLLLVGGVTAWWLGAELRGLAFAHASAAAVTLLLAVILIQRVFHRDELRGLFRAPRLPGFVQFSVPLGAAEFLNAVLQRADVLILTALRGPEAMAVYSAAEYITRSIGNIRYAFDSIIAAVASEALHLGQIDRLRYNLKMTARWVVSVAAPIAGTLIVLRHELLALYGSAYVAGALTVLILAFSHFVNASLGLTGWILVAGGRSRLVLANNAVSIAFNIPAAFFLISRYGYVGAALAALGTVVLSQGLAVIQVALIHQVHLFSKAMLKPLLAAAFTVALEWGLSQSIDNVYARVAAVLVVGAAGYATALLVMGLPAEEKRVADRVFAPFRRK